jgi:hypothetical protein
LYQKFNTWPHSIEFFSLELTNKVFLHFTSQKNGKKAYKRNQYWVLSFSFEKYSKFHNR